MRKTRTPIEVFSLSFLDIISCAFGAVVMLILLAKNGEEGDYSDTRQIGNVLVAVAQAQTNLSALNGALSDKMTLLQQAQSQGASNAQEAEALEAKIARAKNQVQALTDKANGLRQTEIQMKRAAIRKNDTTERAEEVGGIPVDSDYVVFIVDTSGSMKSMWQKVMQTLAETLNNHPDVKGFQILSDNGDVLPGTTLGQWRRDTPAQRRLALSAMRSWNFGATSNSSPVEGIETALRAYGRHNSLALYVFGDDYNGRSYDATLTKINALNIDKKGQKIARIHAIGFKPPLVQWGGEVLKFSTVMRAVSDQNNGTFLAL